MESEALNFLKGRVSIYLIVTKHFLAWWVSGFIHFSSYFLSHSWMTAWRREQILAEDAAYIEKSRLKNEWNSETVTTQNSIQLNLIWQIFLESILKRFLYKMNNLVSVSVQNDLVVKAPKYLSSVQEHNPLWCHGCLGPKLFLAHWGKWWPTCKSKLCAIQHLPTLLLTSFSWEHVLSTAVFNEFYCTQLALQLFSH